MKIGISEIISFFSLLVSIAAIFYARSSSTKANHIASQNLGLQNAMVELEMRQAIENAKSKVNDIAIIMAPLVAQESSSIISTQDAATLELYRKNFDAATQTLLNTYDDACSKYLDCKVDKARFKKAYKFEIRNLLENKDLKEYFDPLTSRYRPILSVYSEWEVTEQ